MSASLLLPATPSPLHNPRIVEPSSRSPYGTCSPASFTQVGGRTTFTVCSPPPAPIHQGVNYETLLPKTESHLIMPNLMTFLRPAQPPKQKQPKQKIPRDASARSLALYGDSKSPEPLIRKCHTVIALSNHGDSSPSSTTTTRVIREKKKKISLSRRISSSKSAVFTSAKFPTNGGLPKSPSAVTDLRRIMRDPSNTFLEEDFRDFCRTGNSSAGCSRCASTASLTSQRLPNSGYDSIFCKLCLSDIPIREMYQLQQCQCRFCRYVSIYFKFFLYSYK